MALIPRKRKGGGRLVDRYTINSSQATAKQVTLSEIPTDPNNVVVDCPNGPVQRINVDYIVTGQVVSWDGYGLETILENGDHLIITY